MLGLSETARSLNWVPLRQKHPNDRFDWIWYLKYLRFFMANWSFFSVETLACATDLNIWGKRTPNIPPSWIRKRADTWGEQGRGENYSPTHPPSFNSPKPRRRKRIFTSKSLNDTSKFHNIGKQFWGAETQLIMHLFSEGRKRGLAARKFRDYNFVPIFSMTNSLNSVW